MGFQPSTALADRKKHALITALTVIFMLLIFSLYANLRWANEYPVFEKAKETGDTPSYIRISEKDVYSIDFWASRRTPIFPLLLSFYHADKVKVAAFQTEFSIIAWGLLALVLAFSFKGFLRPTAFVFVLIFSLERHVAGWDVVMLAESLSISLMALFLAAWLWLLMKWSWTKVAVLSVTAFFWALTRDTNGWVLLMTTGLVLVSVLFNMARRRYLAVTAIFLLLFGASNLSADRGGRWVYPFQNVLTGRILTDAQAIAFFEKCGMPVTPALLSTAGGNAESADRALYVDPTLASYRQWLHADGKSCYMRWLISQPIQTLQKPWKDLAWMLDFEDVSIFFPQRYEPLLPWYLEYILYLQIGHLLLFALITIAALAAIWKKAWKANKVWALFIGMSLMIFPHSFIVWHGDVVGTHRHGLTVSLQFVMSFWLFVLLLLETILSHPRMHVFLQRFSLSKS